MATAGAAALLLAACDRVETDASGWRYEYSTNWEWRPTLTVSKAETDGPGRLLLGCGGSLRFERGQGEWQEPRHRVAARIRIDGGAPVDRFVSYEGTSFTFDFPAVDAGPIAADLARIRRLDVAVMPYREQPFMMRFDLAGVAEAMERNRLGPVCRPVE